MKFLRGIFSFAAIHIWWLKSQKRSGSIDLYFIFSFAWIYLFSKFWKVVVTDKEKYLYESLNQYMKVKIIIILSKLARMWFPGDKIYLKIWPVLNSHGRFFCSKYHSKKSWKEKMSSNFHFKKLHLLTFRAD